MKKITKQVLILISVGAVSSLIMDISYASFGLNYLYYANVILGICLGLASWKNVK